MQHIQQGMTGDQPNNHASEIMLIGGSLLGLCLLISGMLNLIQVETGIAAIHSLDSQEKVSQRIPYIAEIMFAVPLLMGRQRISEMLMQAKFAGSLERFTGRTSRRRPAVSRP